MLRVLVIGAGSIGERHIRCMIETRRAIVGACEPNPLLAATIADRYAVTTYSDIETALRDSWDAAVIAAPAHLHIPIAIRLAEAGLHLLVEKPLAVTRDGVDRLIALVNERSLVASVAYVHRAHPMLQEFRSALRSGEFGTLLQMVVCSGANFPAARPAYRDIYYADRRLGGGAVQDAVSHLLDIGLWLTGPVEALRCDVAHQHLDGVTVEDTVSLIARHGPVLTTYSVNQYQAPTELTITVICSAGTLRYELHANRWSSIKDVGGAWTVHQFDPIVRDDWFRRQENAFLDAVEGKAAPACTLAEGLATLQTVITALASADEGLLPVR